ncbi:hypothetical protein CC78DRAFT_573482 [Lojkania enalia]|uniref:Uncharacterized protein n=1 Tax=Lojkania enalia TaxID=147567 RepID=A0A9P4TS51_9PLEO|nr:hypothetical protein CC78DRAFT_573482 [Didymosphaeria enalia]
MVGRNIKDENEGYQQFFDDTYKWWNVSEVLLTDDHCLYSGGPQGDAHPKDTFCKKQKPADARNWTGGTLLGFSGAYGTGGVEELAAGTSEDKGLIQHTLMIGHYVNNLETQGHTDRFASIMRRRKYDGSYSRQRKYIPKTKLATAEVSDAWHVGTSFSFEYEWGVSVAMSRVDKGADFSWEYSQGKSEESNLQGAIKFIAKIPIEAEVVRVAAYPVEDVMNVTWKAR